MTYEPSPAELLRSQDSIRSDLAELRGELRGYSTALGDLGTRVALTSQELADKRRQHASDVDHLSTRIDELEEWQTWTLRIVLGLIITAVLAGVVILGGR